MVPMCFVVLMAAGSALQYIGVLMLQSYPHPTFPISQSLASCHLTHSSLSCLRKGKQNTAKNICFSIFLTADSCIIQLSAEPELSLS